MRKSPISKIVDEDSGARIWMKQFGVPDEPLPSSLKLEKSESKSLLIKRNKREDDEEEKIP